MSEDNKHSQSTRLVHAGRSKNAFKGTVNPPIQRASTILAESVDDLYGGPSLYGRMGLEVHQTLKDGLVALENASHVQLAQNGLNACALALASVVETGNHVLISDSVYGPTRRFCERFLARMGVGVSFFSPRIDAVGLQALVERNTVAALFEQPGSLTFELHDIEALLPECQKAGLTTLIDNTWGAGVSFKPLDHGFDISIQALTKYIIGHADGFGGAIMSATSKTGQKVEMTATEWGISQSPDDAYLAQRGLRSLPTRYTQSGQSSLTVANWLSRHPAVKHVLHPALPSHPDHHIWKRDFDGTAGLFSIVLHPMSDEAWRKFFSSLTLFGFGFSWGGFESLMIPCAPQLKRSEALDLSDEEQQFLIRLSIGLEAPQDLIGDLEAAFENAASAD